MREHRAKIKAGEHKPTEKPWNPHEGAEWLQPWTDEYRTEMESAWQVNYRRTMTAWLMKQRSPNTRRAYARAWQQWQQWCSVAGLDSIEPTAPTAVAWLEWMRREGKAPATISQYRAAVRGALHELAWEGLRPPLDPFARIPYEKVPDVSTLLPLSDDDVSRVLAAATDLGGVYRTAVLEVSVMGLRAFEAEQVNKYTVVPSQWGPVVTITRKGAKRAIVPVPPIVLEAAAIDGWPMDGHQPKGRGRRIYHLVAKSGARVGVTCTPHQFRHWHVTKALDAGVPLHIVQDSVGHENPTTTRRYDKLRNQVSKHSAFTIAEVLSS
jgi:integrase